jgi:hypothetical protein
MGSHSSLFTKPSDGEHKEQPLQRSAQQQQQQYSPRATTHHPNSADAGHAADPQQHNAQPAACTPTSTTAPVSFGRVPTNSPHHLLTGQRPHGRRRLAQGGREETCDHPMHRSREGPFRCTPTLWDSSQLVGDVLQHLCKHRHHHLERVQGSFPHPLHASWHHEVEEEGIHRPEIGRHDSD